MTSSDVITPGDEHREELLGLMRVAFNMSSSSLAERAAWLPVEKIRSVVEDGRVVAAAAAHDFRQWWGGRELGMSGIWGVVTLPEHRGGGLATRAVTELLVDARARGQSLSALYPATQRPYRGMGYELAGTMTRHAVALDDLPRGPAGPLTVEEYSAERDLDDVRACYRASVSHHPGPIDSDEGDWWPSRVMGQWFSDGPAPRGSRSGRVGGRGVRVVHVRLGSRRAARVRVRDQLPPPRGDVAGSVGVVALVPARVPRPGSDAEVHRSPGASAGAARGGAAGAAGVVVPVDAAAARRSGGADGRGYPPVSEELVLSVEDALFPENRGPWRVVAQDGAVSVEPGRGGDRVRPISIGTLSAIYSGSLSAADAVTFGLVDPASAPALASLFGGPAPWMYDFF